VSVFIGIDPGLNGALAAIGGEHGPQVHDCPTLQSGAGTRHEYDVGAMRDLLDTLTANVSIGRVVVELPAPIPHFGVVTARSIGEAIGIWRTLLVDLPHTFVSPSVWKKGLGLAGKGKEGAVALALREFPSLAEDLRLKRHVDRAEALLLCEWGRRTYG
jgi:crossover junction endodeoxyribonuclease RuvC